MKLKRLGELLERKATRERVTDLVNLDRVRGMLRTIICRRKFLAQQAENRAAEANGKRFDSARQAKRNDRSDEDFV
jgi:hypothetical protein